MFKEEMDRIARDEKMFSLSYWQGDELTLLQAPGADSFPMPYFIVT